MPVAFLPPYGPLLELDGELGLDVGEAVHDALELVEGEAAAAVEVALAHDVVHLVRVRVRVRIRARVRVRVSTGVRCDTG